MDQTQIEAIGQLVTRARSRLATIALALTLSACAGTATERATTSLNVLAAVIEPASKLALKHCDAERQAREDANEPLALEAINKRCADLFDELDRIAALHDAAAQSVEAGNIELAEQLIAQVKKLWRDVGGAL